MFLKLRFLALAFCVLPLFSTAKDGTTSIPFSATDKLSFIENKGQITDQFNKPRNDIQFKVSTPGMNIFIGNGQLHYQFNKVERVTKKGKFSVLDLKEKSPSLTTSYRMDVELLGANLQASVVTSGNLEYTEKYYRAEGTQKNQPLSITQFIEVRSFKKITYTDIYPYIDWVLFVNDNALEYEFVVHPGGNPSNIRLKYKGATSINILENGSFQANTPMGIITEARPYCFQADGKVVNSFYKLDHDVLSFELSGYVGELVIDPVLTWGTYLGGSGTDIIRALDVDNSGNVFCSGYSNSISNIATTGAYQIVNAGQDDIILSKYSATGSILYSTFFGTAMSDFGWCLTHTATDIFIGGSTGSFSDWDVVILKFSTAGTYISNFILGDNSLEECYGIGTNPAGDVFFAGWTTNNTTLATSGAFQSSYGGGSYDGLIGKVSNSLGAGALIWSTFYGGSSYDICYALKVDNSSNIYVAGGTKSPNNIASDTTNLNGLSDGFIAKFNNNGVRQFGTYGGGNSEDNIRALTLDNAGNIYVTGATFSDSGLATAGAFQTGLNSLSTFTDAWVGKYTNTGTKLWASYYGGNGYDQAECITSSDSGIIIGGFTNSSSGIASPIYANQPNNGGGDDGFMAKFNAAGTRIWGTYFGGGGFDYLFAIASSGPSNFYVAGHGNSTSGIATMGAPQTIINGLDEGFVAKFTECSPVPATPTVLTGPSLICAGATYTYAVQAVPGATSYQYTLPFGFIGTSTVDSITITAGLNSGIISVAAVNACGPGLPLSTPITVFAVPTAWIVATGNLSICPGGSVLLSGNTGMGNYYQWTLNNVNIPGATNSTYTATAQGTYQLFVSNIAGCSGTSSNSKIVTVVPTPAIPSITTNSPICAGQTLHFTVTNTTPGLSYLWVGPNGYNSSDSIPVITNANSNNSGVYNLTVGNIACSTSASTSVIVSSSIPVKPLGIVGNVSVCGGDTETYYVPNNASVVSYNWNLPASWSGASITNSITAIAGSGSGVITVSAQNGCGTSPKRVTYLSSSAPQVVTINQMGSTLMTSKTFVTYQWYLNGTAIPGATNQGFTTTQSGDYYVVVFAGACNGQSNTVTVTTGITSLGFSSDLVLFPNPNSGGFTIKGRISNQNEVVKIMIADVTGRIIHRGICEVKGNYLEHTVTLENIPAGVYIVRITSEQGSKVLPFVKK